MKSHNTADIRKIAGKVILYSAVFLYLFFLMSKCNEKMTYFEIDSYVLPTISLEYRGSLLMNQDDLKRAQEDYPTLYDGIDCYNDLRSAKLKITSSGQWESCYFPIYSILCMPAKLVLQMLHLDQELTFGITNIFCMLFLFLLILSSKKLLQVQKILAFLLLTAAPSFLYVQLISAEMMIFCFVGIGMLKFYEKKYKTGAIFITLAGMSNATVMAIGIVFIFDYYANVFGNSKNKNYLEILKDEIVPSMQLAFCFLPGFLPFIFKSATGVKNYSPASAAGDWTGVFYRALVYLFDPNLGFFSFAPVAVIVCIGLLFYAVCLKKYRAISFMAAFLGTILAYSLMPHINCGMLYCARYVYWTYPVLVIFMVIYGYECFERKYVFIGVTIVSVFTGALFMQFNTNTYYRYTVFNQFTEWVLDNMPGVYQPLRSTFCARVLHADGGYKYTTPVVYENNEGYVRKILASKDNAEELLAQFDASDDDRKWFEMQVAALTEKEKYISVPAKYQITHNQEYKPGTAIKFAGDSYNADRYAVRGISYKEKGYSWTDGEEFKIRYRINSQSEWMHGSVELAMVYNKQQKVTVLVNDEVVFQDMVVHGDNIEFDFLKAKDMRVIEMKVLLPDAVSPQELGKGKDERKLALAVKQMVFTEMDREYELGTAMMFAKDTCDADQYVLQGISYQEDGYRWTDGEELRIRYQLNSQSEWIHGSMELAMVYNERQKVTVMVNDEEVFQNTVANGDSVEFDFQRTGDMGVIDMKVLLPDAVSPQESGESEDERKLALAVKQIVFTEMKRKYKLGTDISFGGDACNADKYVVQGISFQEDGYRWTEGKELRVRCRLKDRAQQIHGLFELRQVIHGQQNVTVLVNGREVFRNVVKNGDNIEFDFDTENNDVIDMKVLLPDAVSPAALGESTDQRELGLAIERIVLSET